MCSALRTHPRTTTDSSGRGLRNCAGQDGDTSGGRLAAIRRVGIEFTTLPARSPRSTIVHRAGVVGFWASGSLSCVQLVVDSARGRGTLHQGRFRKQENPRVNGGFLWRYRWDLNPLRTGWPAAWRGPVPLFSRVLLPDHGGSGRVKPDHAAPKCTTNCGSGARSWRSRTAGIRVSRWGRSARRSR